MSYDEYRRRRIMSTRKALSATTVTASVLALLAVGTATSAPSATPAKPAIAPRRCRAQRTLDITSPSTSGRILELGSIYPTTKAGRFSASFPAEYGFTDEEGQVHEGSVPLSGVRRHSR